VRRRPGPIASRVLFTLVAFVAAGCGSDTTNDPIEPDDTRFPQLSVTILPNSVVGCSIQFSADQDGAPFGVPAELVGLRTEGPDNGATVLFYNTVQPPTNCPPQQVTPDWSGGPGVTATFEPPMVFGPGTAATVQVDCDACAGNEQYKVIFEVRDLP
jgi:hypothetical protein